MKRTSCLTCPWRETGPLKYLPDDKLRGLSEGMNRFEIKRRGAAVFHQAQPSSGVYFICEGRVKLTSLTPEGHEVILDVQSPCSAISTPTHRSYELESYSAESLDSVVEVAYVNPGLLEETTTVEPLILSKIWKETNERLRRAYEHVKMLKLPIEERVRSLMISLAKIGRPYKEGDMIEIPLSSSELGQYAQTTSETVSRVLAKFRKQGLVRVIRGKVLVSAKNHSQLRGHGRE